MIQAIETEYGGVRFRSRLEARWAFFFDQLGIAWEYEPEPFKLSTGQCYLPDFRLPKYSGGLWVEVKPEGDPFTLARQFSRDAQARVLLAEGPPSARVFLVAGYDLPEHDFDLDVVWSSKYVHSENRFYVSGCDDDVAWYEAEGVVQEAFDRARGHRFWEPSGGRRAEATPPPISADEARTTLARLSADAEATRAQREAAEAREHERGAERLRARLEQLKGKSP